MMEEVMIEEMLAGLVAEEKETREWRDLTLQDYEHLFQHFSMTSLDEFVHVQWERDKSLTAIDWKRMGADYLFQSTVYKDKPRRGLWVECRAVAQHKHAYRRFLHEDCLPYKEMGWDKAIARARAVTYHMLFSRILLLNVEWYTHPIARLSSEEGNSHSSDEAKARASESTGTASPIRA